MQRTASQGTLVSYEHCFSHQRREIPLYYSYAGLDIQETLRNTLGCIFPCFFCQKNTWDMFCTPVCTSWCHCHENDATPSYIVSNSEANRTNGSQDTAISVSYPSPWISSNLTIISHPAPETWHQIQCHSNSSPSLPRPLQMLLPVCWQLRQHQSVCPSTTGTPKMHTTPFPYFAIPWRTGSSSSAFCLTVRTTSGMFLQP